MRIVSLAPEVIEVRIHKGDRVQVLTGKDRGKTGEVMRVIPAQNRVIVDFVLNGAQAVHEGKARHHAGRHHRQGHAGSRLDGGGGLRGRGPTRIGFRVDDQGRKIRVCRKCGGDL